MRIGVFGADSLGSAARRLVARAARAGLGRRSRGPGELCVVFVSDARLRRLNAEHLGADRETDVIAFPYETTENSTGEHRRETGPKEQAPFGDIYIATGVARRQARAMGHDLLTELLTLTVHGALHLVGYDDHRPDDKRRMFARQDRIVRSLLPSRHQKTRAVAK